MNRMNWIVIENPEQFLHPGLFQPFLGIVDQLRGDCSVILTSRSPDLVSRIPPEWIAAGVSREPGIAEFHTLKEAGSRRPEEDAARCGQTTGACLFSLMTEEDGNGNDYFEDTDKMG